MFQQQWFPVASYEKFTKSLGWFQPKNVLAGKPSQNFGKFKETR